MFYAANLMTDQSRLLSPTQLAILIVVISVAVLIIVGNIILGYFRHRNSVRTLCTRQLQEKRNELLARLEEVKSWGAATDDTEEDSDAEDDSEDEEDDDKEEVRGPAAFEVPTLNENGAVSADILAVKDMSPEMRLKYGLNGEEYLDKRYYVHYNYGFDAKLRNADPTVQKRYAAFSDEVRQYMGVTLKNSFRGQRICKGQKTLGQILFKGKTLCVAFALDPASYADTKYRGIDKSGTKRFANTPLLLKLVSDRKLEYAKYLLVQVADANTILLSETPVEEEYDFSQKSNSELFLMNSLRIQFMGEVPAETETSEK